MSPYGRRVAILGGTRIPFARVHTAYAEHGNQEMLTAALGGLVERFGLRGERLGEVAAGAVLKHSRDWNLARESALGSGLAPETPAYDVQMACGTGLQATVLVANKIALGQIDAGIAGGVDSASDLPLGVNDELRRILLRLRRARGAGERLRLLARLRPRHFLRPEVPGGKEPRTGLSMGEHCERMAKEWGIARADQDALALESHRRALRAWEEGFFKGLVVPFAGLERDNNVRADTSPEKLAALRPAFDPEAGTLTAGNSTPLTDGASAVLLASEDWARGRGLAVQAYLAHAETAAVDFVGGEGLLMAPAYAVPRLLRRAGVGLQDFDFYEIHEAFAAQVLCTLKAWEDSQFCRERLSLDAPLGPIDRGKLNVKGGSVAIGHPFAATGGRILATLATLLEDRGGGRGMISICAAGGQGVVAILEK
jgi:acetyl-CoA C-acetyltransferase